MKTAKAVQNFLEAKQGFSPRTLEQYTVALNYLKQECPQMPRRPVPLREALNKLGHPWTRDAYWRVWGSFFRWSSLEYRIWNVFSQVSRPKRPDKTIRPLELEELSRLFSATADLRDRAIIALALDSGIRASEFGQLRLQDIGTNTLWVWGKGNKQVCVPLSPETHHLLDLLIENNGYGSRPQSLLFPGFDGGPISRFAVYHVVEKAMKRAGIVGNKMGPHLLRHSLGANYIADGGDPFSLKRIMRHKSISTTQKYVNLAMKTIVKQHNQYSPLKKAMGLIEEEHQCPPHHWRIGSDNIGRCAYCPATKDFSDLPERARKQLARNTLQRG